MKKIKLSQGKYAIVDDEDFYILAAYKWYFSKGYAVSCTGGRKSRKYLYMHRFLLGLGKKRDSGISVDHINNNGLDNRKSNLRKCSNSQNSWNQSVRKVSTTGYKGVSSSGSKYVAHIGVFYKKIHLGSFMTKEDAALAYNQAALKYHGEFAVINKL